MSRSRGEPKAAAIAELAPKLTASSLPKDALLKILKQASGLLAELGQVASASVQNTIKPFVEAVGQQSILRHKDKDVKLLAASCISELLRLCAPNAPYEDSKLKDIFRLFTSVFEGLNEVTGSSYLKRVAILESLSKVKSCVMILDLDDEELVLNFMETLFDVINLDQGRNVRMAILEVLAILIEESEDITQPLLDMLLLNLFSPKKNENPAACQLAQALLKREVEVLRNPLQQFLLSAMLKGKSDSNLKKDYHDVIYEVYRSAPQLLLNVLPNLEAELQVDQVETRLKAVDLLGKIFCIPGDQAATDYRPLYTEFVHRFNDKNLEVRTKMVQWAQSFLPSAPEAQAKEISDKLRQRLEDYEDKIRAQTVLVTCEVASVNPDVVSVELLKDAANRMRDKKVSVRKEALKAFTKLYKNHVTEVMQGQGGDESKFAWIPARILLLIYDKDIKYQHTKSLFEEELFPANIPIEQRAQNWIAIFSMLDDTEKKGLTFLLTIKERAQREMRNYLGIRQRLKEAPDDEGLQARKTAAFRTISNSFLEPNKAVEHFMKLDQLKDNGIFKGLSQLLDTNVSMAATKKAQEDLLKRLGQKHAQHDFLKSLAQKISYNLVSKDLALAVLDRLKADESDSSPDLLTAAANFLVAIVSLFPHLLADSVDQLSALLEEESDLLKDAGTQLLAKVGAHLKGAAEASQVESTLEKLCLDGTRKQAKNAMLALLSLEDASTDWLDELYDRLYSALHESHNLPTVIQSLGCIAQHRVELFSKLEDDIVRFVIKSILKQPTDTVEEQDFNSPSDACSLQTYALKMLVKSFLQPELSLKENKRSNRLIGLLNLLSKLISGNGQLAVGVEMSEVDKAHVRLAAAKGILRLSRYHSAHVPPDLVEKTSLVVQDHAVEVRRDFLAKVRARLVEKRLPQKWAVVLCLATIDEERELASEARKYLAEYVELKRREGHAKQAAADAEKHENVLQYHPETVLMHLLHLLAHHPDYPIEEEAEDASAYELFQKILVFTLKALTHSDAESRAEANREENDNLPALFAILRHIKGAEDAVEPPMTERIYVLTDLSLAILKELTSKRLWNSGAYPGEVLLPSAYFKVAGSASGVGENEVVKTKADGSHLPKCLQNIELTKIAKTPRTPRANGGLSSPTVKAGISPKGNALAVTGRKRKAHQKKRVATSDEEESEEEEEPEARLPKTPKTSAKGKAGALVIPKATPKPLEVASPPWRDEAQNGAGSEAVGKRIRVWWSMDRVFYLGDVTTFNPKTGKHRILYDDGEIEELDLAKQRWDFVDDNGDLRDSEEDRLRKSGVLALTAPATPQRRGKKSPAKNRSAKKDETGTDEQPKRKAAPRGKKKVEKEASEEDNNEEEDQEVEEQATELAVETKGGQEMAEEEGGGEAEEPEEKPKRGRKKAGDRKKATPAKGAKGRKQTGGARAVSKEEPAQQEGGENEPAESPPEEKKAEKKKAASPRGRKGKKAAAREPKAVKQVKAGITEKDEEEANEKLEVEEVEERPSKRKKGITAESESQEPLDTEALTTQSPKVSKSSADATEEAGKKRKARGGTKRGAAKGGGRKGRAADPPPVSDAFDWNETQEEEPGKPKESEREQEGAGTAEDLQEGPKNPEEGARKAEEGAKEEGPAEENENEEDEEDTQPTTTVRSRKRRVR